MKRLVVDLNEEEYDLLWEMIDKYHDACKEVDDYVSVDILEDIQDKFENSTYDHDI
tara:strand:- start:781 stop:948 length:168 start_codon:yes stop_codon:yes gene_type:complete